MAEPIAGNAMQEAVAAEQAARAAIAAAEAAGRDAVERGRAQARAIVNRLPVRAARLQARIARVVQRALAAIAAEEADAARQLQQTVVPPDVLARTVAAVVRGLTSDASGETPR